MALLRKMTCNLRHPSGLRHPILLRVMVEGRWRAEKAEENHTHTHYSFHISQHYQKEMINKKWMVTKSTVSLLLFFYARADFWECPYRSTWFTDSRAEYRLFCRISSLLQGSFAKETYKRDDILQISGSNSRRYKCIMSHTHEGGYD